MNATEHLEAASLAAAAERRNRPVALLLAALALLAVAVVYAVIGGVSAAGAGAQLDLAVKQRSALLEKNAHIEQLRADPSRSVDADRYRPEEQYRTKLQAINDQIGLATPPTLGSMRDRRFDANSPFVRKELDVTISAASPEQGLRWLELAGEQIDGLHVIGLELRPETNGWTFRVRLARWEVIRT